MWQKIFLLFFFFILFSAFHSKNSSPNSESGQSFTGTILSIQKYTYANRPVPYVQLILRVNKETYSVELGPNWYLKAEGFSLEPNEVISVHGKVTRIQKKNIIQAFTIQKNGEVLHLREKNGLPKWNPWKTIQSSG